MGIEKIIVLTVCFFVIITGIRALFDKNLDKEETQEEFFEHHLTQHVLLKHETAELIACSEVAVDLYLRLNEGKYEYLGLL